MKRHISVTPLSLVALSLVFVAIAGGVLAQAAAGDLDSAKALYAAASYEEALATLDQLGAADSIQVNQYRALCLLALGRARDAEAPLQQIVSADPLYKLPAGEVSPRLVDLFRDVVSGRYRRRRGSCIRGRKATTTRRTCQRRRRTSRRCWRS